MPSQTPGSGCERAPSALLITDTEPRPIATAASGRKHQQLACFFQAKAQRLVAADETQPLHVSSSNSR